MSESPRLGLLTLVLLWYSASPVQYTQYAWPPQPTGAPAAPVPAPTSTPAPATTTTNTPQPIRAKPATPAPANTASPKPATTATTTPATPAPTTTAPYAAPYYAAAAPPGYRYPYPPPQYQGQPQYAYAYAQAPGGAYYAVAAPPQTPVAPTTTPAPGTTTPAQQPQTQRVGGVVLPSAGASTAAAVAGLGGPQQQQPTSTLNDALAGIVDLRVSGLSLV